MAMKENSFQDFGFVINDETKNIIMRKFISEEDMELELWDEDEIIESLKDELALSYETEFTGVLYPLKNNGCVDYYKPDNYYNDEILYLSLDKEPNLFQATYTNLEEIIKEIKGKISKYLPEDFNYANSIVMIVGFYWG